MRTVFYKVLARLLLMISLLPVNGLTKATPEAASLWQPGWQCGQASTVSRAFLNALIKNNALHGYALNGVTLPLLIGQNPAESGAILFAKRNNVWQAYPIADGSAVLAAYSTPSLNRVTVFATWGREGPGTDYIVLQGKNQLSDFSCTTVPLPAELNRPNWGNSYPGLHGFNMDAQGRGTLITAAYLPAAGNDERKQWYQYSSNDWGSSWSEARKIPAIPAKLSGIFQSLTDIPAPAWLVKSLLASTP
ncbi:MAG: hypothetical protein BWK73_20805 [Thiothrix lacustris]|uniref:Sialidase domain-containing protein n=1 Tax=Thiothrix lacustris TaxID=525917 RepID=A0A1Y1QP51_9GAMM|nr:MAG: hypothetical protein BWK73_20805 [Thiothrix lacustris]